MRLITLIALALTVLLIPAPCAFGLPADELFAAAEAVPADVSVFVHVENAAGIRAELADRPIARWTNALFASGSFHRAWSAVAKATELSESQLFDRLFGRSFTLVTREPGQWAVLTSVDERSATQLLQQLKVRVLTPKFGLALSELPEQEMLIARDGDRMIIGGSKAAGLFFDLLPRVAHAAAPETPGSLGGQAFMKDAKSLGSGAAAVFVRHAKPLGGQTIAVVDLHGDAMTVRNFSEFDAAPFSHAVTRLTCDFSPITGFRDHALLAVAEPMDIGDGPFEAFLQANLKQGMVSEAMRRNLKDRRLIVVGERDLRTADAPVDILCPTLVSCLEIKDKEPAVQQLDEQMVRLARSLGEVSKGTMLQPLQTPNLRVMNATEPREVDLQPVLCGGFPVMKSVSLTWTVADGPGGSWFVVGSDRRWLDDVVKVLLAKPAPDERLIGKFDSCGAGNGVRISRHLQSWSNQAALLADPQHVEEMRSTLCLMADLAGGIQHCDWQLARPSPNQMRLDVQIQLAPPESTRIP